MDGGRWRRQGARGRRCGRGGLGGWFSRPARTRIGRQGGGRGGGVAGVKAVGEGGGCAVSADVAMRPAPPASAHRAARVVAPPPAPAPACPAAAQKSAGRECEGGGADKERAAAA